MERPNKKDYLTANQIEYNQMLNKYYDDLEAYIDILEKQLTLTDVGCSLPDLDECNQASLDYATKKNNPDFFLIKQTFKDGVNWALNYVTIPK